MGSAEMIRDLLTPSIASEGLELWDVEMSRDVVRVLIDRPGGIDLDGLAAVAAGVVSPFSSRCPVRGSSARCGRPSSCCATSARK